VAHLSDSLLFAAVVVYALAMLGFAGDQATRRARRVLAEPALRATPSRVLAGAGRRAGRVPSRWA
jgi:hypothetical protein